MLCNLNIKFVSFYINYWNILILVCLSRHCYLLSNILMFSCQLCLSCLHLLLSYFNAFIVKYLSNNFTFYRETVPDISCEGIIPYCTSCGRTPTFVLLTTWQNEWGISCRKYRWISILTMVNWGFLGIIVHDFLELNSYF